MRKSPTKTVDVFKKLNAVWRRYAHDIHLARTPKDLELADQRKERGLDRIKSRYQQHGSCPRSWGD